MSILPRPSNSSWFGVTPDANPAPGGFLLGGMDDPKRMMLAMALSQIGQSYGSNGRGGGQAGGGMDMGSMMQIMQARKAQEARAAALAQKQAAMASMPLPSGYAPKAYAAPNGEDGKPLADPINGLTDAQRYAVWGADAAQSGVDYKVPELKDLMAREHVTGGDLSSFDPMSNTGRIAVDRPEEGKVIDNALVDPITGEVRYKGEYTLAGGNGGPSTRLGPDHTPLATGAIGMDVKSVNPEYNAYITPAQGPKGVGGAPAVDAAAVQQTLAAALGDGFRITSGRRTPERNSAVGGAPNSYHLSGHAFDVVPPPGVSTAEAKKRLRASGIPLAELIDEGDHVHVAWKGAAAPSAPGMQVVPGRPKADDAASPYVRDMTPAEVAARGLAAGTVASVNTKTGDYTIKQRPAQTAVGVKPTEGQAKNGFNAKRMAGAAQIITGLEAKGFDAGAARVIPGFLPGNEDKRKYEAAQREWADSLLRITSGAQASKDEINNTVSTYFPQIGDSPAVRQQKAAARARAERDAMSSAGPGGAPAPGQRPAPRPNRAQVEAELRRRGLLK
jgi:hypothetical protein